MAGSPNLDELKVMCGSDEVHKCLKFLLSQQIPLNEIMIQCLGEKRDELQISVDKRSETMDELLDHDFDKEPAANDGYESLHEVQVIERRLLASLAAILVDLRALVAKKEEAIADMDYYDQSSSS